MTDTTPLSPAAQAVLDALHTENSTGPERYWARANAAALRAAADRIGRRIKGANGIRQDLLDIVNELEGAQ